MQTVVTELVVENAFLRRGNLSQTFCIIGLVGVGYILIDELWRQKKRYRAVCAHNCDLASRNIKMDEELEGLKADNEIAALKVDK